jgi:LexA-binding, inner membrane-associated putative hydrolase
MSPVTHFFAGWLLASTFPGSNPLTRREKALVVAAAVAPDLDGLGIVPELLTRNTSHPLLWFSEYHHSLHTLAFALVCAFAAYIIAGPMVGFTFGPVIQGRRLPTHPWLTVLLVFISFHLHLLCDLIGARGPDGDQWPIPYLKPFSNSLQLTWQSQWALNGWQNFAITSIFLLATFWISWRYAKSPLELISEPANQALTRTLRQRFRPDSAHP